MSLLLKALIAAGLTGACAEYQSEPVTDRGQIRGSGQAASRPAARPTVSLVRAFPRVTFRRPIYLTHAGDGSDRLFVLEQAGRILVFENDRDGPAPQVFLDLRSQVRMSHNEEGLLALAFHPKYSQNGYFYVHYSASKPRHGVLSRFTVDQDNPNQADPESEQVILEVEQPWGNHNGSTVLFGPDGYLYISLGDGGSAADPLGSGQDLSTLLGTILRIDIDRQSDGRAYAIPADNPFVNQPGARDEIWAYGLRNVWRMSFDRKTGDLWAGDVGQNAWEEIDLIVKGGNYGWNVREGSHPFRGSSSGPLIDPVVEYPQRRGREIVGLSVTGGYVYRGSEQKALYGVYLYADYVTGRIWGLRYQDGRLRDHWEASSPPPRVFVASFGEDEAGELYICGFDGLDGRGGGAGRIYRVVAE